MMTERSLQRDRLNREELVASLTNAIPLDGTKEPLEGIRLARASVATDRVHGVSKPSLCVIAQGIKEIYLGEGTYRTIQNTI